MTELKGFPGCPTGDAVRTRGHHLRARYVIHSVGPVWRGGGLSEPALLARAYENAFARAKEAGDVRSIAFPAISTGVYGYPKPEAAAIALRSMVSHDAEYERIVACLFDEGDAQLYRATLVAVRQER